ncbi:hypothetical protein EDB89DRAFT_2071757 [Lactarius sanguifluus]|nr:hypothetical protein EDB89DRAFT_2071757 [Lactarius sanguifluus]
MLHSRVALATRTQRVPDSGGHFYEVSRRAEVFRVASPDLAALARGFHPSTPTRPRFPRTYIRKLASRGDLRDALRRFTPPNPSSLSR